MQVNNVPVNQRPQVSNDEPLPGPIENRRLTRAEFEQELNDWANHVDILPEERADRLAKIPGLLWLHGSSYDECPEVEIHSEVLTLLPAVLGEFQSLESLTLTIPKLAEFPKITCPMPNIQALKIGCGDDLKALPANFSELFPNLRSLDCQGSRGLVIKAEQIVGLNNLVEPNFAGTATDIPALLREAPRFYMLIGDDGAPIQDADVIERARTYMRAEIRDSLDARLTRIEAIVAAMTAARAADLLADSYLPRISEAVAYPLIDSKLAQIPPSPIWPKLDDYINKILRECVPHYLSEDAVLQVLDAAVADPVLANKLLVIAATGDLARCLDNRLRTFHDMQVAVEVAAALVEQQQAKSTQPLILLKVLSGHYRNHLLSAFAKEMVGESSELLEVELFLRYRLKESLNLACPIKDMLHKKLAETMITRPITGSGERVTSEKVLNDAQNFVFDREKDQAAWALWLVGDPNWLIWLEQKCEVNLKRLESQLQREIEGVDKEFAQLPLTEQDDQLVAYAERKQRLEEQFKTDKFEYLLDVTHALISQSGANWL